MTKRILIVDDESDFTNVLKATLEMTGKYRVRTVNTSSRAVQEAREFQPDLVLLDCMMPEMDGGQVAWAMQGDPVLRRVPFAFLSATVSREQSSPSSCYEGMRTYLPKPIQLARLVAFIEEQTTQPLKAQKDHAAGDAAGADSPQRELFLAVASGDQKRASAILESDPSVALAVGARGMTPLHFAASQGNASAAELILRHGADVNATSQNGATPLHLAAYRGHHLVAELLVERGARVNARDRAGETPLHGAAYKRRDALVQFLIERGADVKAADESALTPLHWAALGGSGPVARLLLLHGADPNATDGAGATSLHDAVIRGQVEVAAVLLAHGADPNAGDEDGNSPLHLAT